MPWKPNISLIKCGTCGKAYNNPLNHTCVVRLDYKRRAKVKPKRRRGR